jgi:hypothetical protein
LFCRDLGAGENDWRGVLVDEIVDNDSGRLVDRDAEELEAPDTNSATAERDGAKERVRGEREEKNRANGVNNKQIVSKLDM